MIKFEYVWLPQMGFSNSVGRGRRGAMAGNGVWAKGVAGMGDVVQRVIGRNASLPKDGRGGGEVQKDCIMFARRRRWLK